MTRPALLKRRRETVQKKKKKKKTSDLAQQPVLYPTNKEVPTGLGPSWIIG